MLRIMGWITKLVVEDEVGPRLWVGVAVEDVLGLGFRDVDIGVWCLYLDIIIYGVLQIIV